MITEEILKAILEGREFRRVGNPTWLKHDAVVNSYIININADYELRPIAPEFAHWHMLPGWANRWVAMDNHGSWYSYEFEPESETHTWNGKPHLYETIPDVFWPIWKGDWRDSKIENPNAPGVWVTREKLRDETFKASDLTGISVSEAERLLAHVEKGLGL